MYFYDYKTDVTNATDTNPLVVTGYIKVFLDEAKSQYLTEIPFPKFSFSETEATTTEEFNAYIQEKISTLVNSEEWQNKLNELKLAYDLGVYVPAQN